MLTMQCFVDGAKVTDVSTTDWEVLFWHIAHPGKSILQHYNFCKSKMRVQIQEVEAKISEYEKLVSADKLISELLELEKSKLKLLQEALKC